MQQSGSEIIKAILVDLGSAAPVLVEELVRVSLASAQTVEAVETLQLCRSREVSLVFIDLHSSKVRPVELCRDILRENPEALIVFLTSLNDKQLVIDGFQAGATEVLKSPIQLGELRALVARLVGLLNRRRQRQFSSEMLLSAQVSLELKSDNCALSPAVRAVTGLLTGVASWREIKGVELALDEILRNAHEHGNLGIGSDEKHQAMELGTYEQLVESRVQQGAGRDKVIALTASLRGRQFSCTVADQGHGFDWRSLTAKEPSPEDLLNPGGRGLLLMRQYFETITFNDLGNSVTVSKTFST